MQLKNTADVMKLISNLDNKGVKTVQVRLVKGCRQASSDFLGLFFTPAHPIHTVRLRDLKEYDLQVAFKKNQIEVVEDGL